MKAGSLLYLQCKWQQFTTTECKSVTAWRQRTNKQFWDRINFFFLLFRAKLAAYGGSQARGPIGAVATGLCYSHSHSNARSELCYLHHSSGQCRILNPLKSGIKPACLWILVRFVSAEPWQELQNISILSVVTVSLIYRCVKTNQIVHFTYVQCSIL